MKVTKKEDKIFIEMKEAEADETLRWYGEHTDGELAQFLYRVLYEGLTEIQSLSAHQREILRSAE